MTPAGDYHSLRLVFHPDWDPTAGVPGPRGLFAPDPRARTLLKVLVSYPEVRHVLPDRISLEAGADPRLLEVIARFLDRQRWLVKQVLIR